MNCLICKVGVYKPGRVTVKLERGAAIVLVKQVPAEVCDTCSNYLLDQATTKKVLEIANDSFDSGAELEVRTLKAA